MPTTKSVAVISSTARDLPEHRKHVMDACQRCTCDFVWMETLPACDDDAVKVSMALVDKADIYIGIFAHRYGYVPAGSEISITEMEYDRAKKRGIPCLIFFMHDEHAITIAMVETGPGAAKLDQFKQRIGVNHVAAFFKSPEDLRAHVLHALPETLKSLQSPEAAAAIPSLHFVHPIPKPPEPYIAHYYALLQTGKIIGRRPELDVLTQWITKSPHPMMHVIAIGGMGKSALTWHWFHHIAPQEWPKMKGRIWWSFYESDGHFENFVTRNLAYVSGQSEAEVRKQNLRDRCDSLIRILHQEPYLVVLDGLERLLAAYARMDAPYLADGDVDEKTMNAVYDLNGYPQGFYQTAVSRHSLRLAADPNVGRFFKVLCQIQASRVLTSSRLFPTDLQRPDGHPIAGCQAIFLQGLSESDALELWREYGCKGSSEKMLPIFRSFGFHPLVLKVFAGKVANYRLAPGDFDKWHEANPDFKPYSELHQDNQSHILSYALRDLSEAERQTLNIIAGLRMAAGIETLQAVLVEQVAKPQSDEHGKDGSPGSEPTSGVSNLKAPFRTLGEMDAALTLLEDRGLLGWDRCANRYDLHPIVRGVVWDLVQGADRQAVCEKLRGHFDAIPKPSNPASLDELTSALELYEKLISLDRYDDALATFSQYCRALIYPLRAGAMASSLLLRLFDGGDYRTPRIRHNMLQACVHLSASVGSCGRIGHAGEVLEYLKTLVPNDAKYAIEAGLGTQHIEWMAGKLRLAECHTRTAVCHGRQGHFDSIFERLGLVNWGRLLGARGLFRESHIALSRSTAMMLRTVEIVPAAWGYLRESEMRLGDIGSGKVFATVPTHRLLGVCRDMLGQLVGELALFARIEAVSAFESGDLMAAAERLNEAQKAVNACDLVDEELPTLIALAELQRRQNDPAKAREYLDEVWDKCERGPYPLFHADALSVLAQIERDADHRAEAIAVATQAYQKAWCDGPPFAYHWGLEAAKKHLRELGAPFPDMPAFDESKYPPMPEVEINPRDEYYVEEEPT